MSDIVVNAHGASRKHTERLAQVLLVLIGFGCLLLAADLAGLRPYDSTDNGTKRSGMRPHIDAQTGCEYLSVAGGDITPRMGADGRQIGCRP